MRSGSAEQFGQHPLEFLELRADAAGGIEDERRVAQHPHACEQPLQPFELLLRQRPPLGDVDQTRGLPLELVVAQALLVGHADQVVRDGAAGQFGLHVALAPAEHHRLQPAHQLVEVLVADRTAAFVKVVKIAIEAEQRTQQAGIEVLHDRVDLVDAVLDRRAGQHERIGRRQRLHRARRLGVPVLDPLRLVEDDDVRPQRAG